MLRLVDVCNLDWLACNPLILNTLCKPRAPLWRHEVCAKY